MQSLDEKKEKGTQTVNQKGKSSDSDSESSQSSSSDNSFSESDETDEMNRVHIKVPLELSLSDIAHSILQQNQKYVVLVGKIRNAFLFIECYFVCFIYRSRMNCVIERRRAEELVDQQPKMMQLPFGVAINMEPKKRRVTGERMAIFCESGTGLK